MFASHLLEAERHLEKANTDLEPELLSADGARKVLATYARIKKLASFGRRHWHAGSTTFRRWRA